MGFNSSGDINMKKISLQYNISLKDFLDAYEYHWRLNKLGTKSNSLLALTGIIIGLFSFVINYIAGIVISVCSVILIVIIMLRKFLYTRAFKNSPKYVSEIKVLFTDNNIVTENAAGKSELNWSIYNKFIENKDYFLLYLSNNSFSIIPKRAFQKNEDLDDFRNMLKKI